MPTGYAIEVHDGDTFSIHGNIRIRLAGVNAAELGDPYSRMATDKLKELILNKTIHYEEVGRSFDRIVANVWVNSTNVNEAMKDYIKRITR